MTKIYKSIIIIILFVSFLNCTGNKIKKVIAEYNSGVVYLKEAVEEFNDLSDSQKKDLNNEDGYYRFIRSMAIQRIVLDNAYKDGLDNDKEVKNAIDRAKKETAFEILKKKNVVDKIVVGKEDYKKYKKRYEIYQIVKRKDILDQAKIEESKKLLKDLSKEIKDLSSFIENAKKYSEDHTASSGGYYGKINHGMMQEEIEKVLEKLKIGEVSDVVESSIGFHIFYLNDIEEVEDEELYKSDELFNSIYKEKRAYFEENWYNKLLKDRDLKIYKDKLKDRVYDNQVIVEYKDKTVTRDEFFKIVDNYKIYSLPEPTEEDLIKLLEKIGLELILKYKSDSKAIYDSKDYKKRIKEQIKFILMNRYIAKSLEIPEASEEAIKEFYDANIKTLFTFQLEDGQIFIQPLDEVKKMIVQKLEENNIIEARYNLYRKLADESNLKVNKELFNDFKKRIKI